MEVSRDRYLEKLIEREWNGSVKIITGIRRCGKSYLLFKLFRNHLISSGVSDDHIISIALDDYANRHLRSPDALYEHVVSLRNNIRGPCYLLLDEIQLVDGFTDVVNGFRHMSEIDIYVTGSNSKFLSSDILTEFRGRGDEIRVHPLSFSEYLSAFPGRDVTSVWKEYMVYGGMPELLNRNAEENKANYLKALVDETYFKDIRDRNDVRMPSILENIFDVLCSYTGSLTNPVKIRNTIRTVYGVDVSINTLDRYLQLMEDSFLFEKVQRYDIKGRKYLGALYKFYPADVGLRNARLNFRQIEVSHLMENIIYNELRSRGLSVDIGIQESRMMKDGETEYKQLEIDFVVNKMDSRWYIQSAYSISDRDKEEQEIRPFRMIKDGFQRVLVVGDDVPRHRNDEGVLIIGIREFLLDRGLFD